MFIPDPKLPIFIPYGYRSIGKTMIIMRLTRFLYQEGYTVRPNLVFKSVSDQRYHNLCQRYMEQVFNTYALTATGINDTLLLDVINQKGEPVCGIIDQAGEHQYDMDSPYMGISQEMREIIKLPNPKIWGFVIEYNSLLDIHERQGYAQNIWNIANNALASENKVLFIYNKVDLTPFMKSEDGTASLRELFDSADSSFPGIFKPFEETNLIKRILKGRYKFKMIPFQTGVFNQREGDVIFSYGRDEYPKHLWEKILESIR